MIKNYMFKNLNGGTMGIGSEQDLNHVVKEVFAGERPVIFKDPFNGSIEVITNTGDRYQVLTW